MNSLTIVAFACMVAVASSSWIGVGHGHDGQWRGEGWAASQWHGGHGGAGVWGGLGGWGGHGGWGPSGVVTGAGASGPSGTVTGHGAAGPAGVVTGHGAVGPDGSSNYDGHWDDWGHGGWGHGHGHW